MSMYIVTQDLPSLMEGWCRENNYRMIDSGFLDDQFNQLIKFLQDNCFPKKEEKVKVVGFKQNEEFFRRLNRKEGSISPEEVFWISIDKAYAYQADYTIDITRIVDSKSHNDIGRGPRPSSRIIKEQMEECFKKYKSIKPRPKMTVLVDDGIYEGKTLLKVLTGLHHLGLLIDEVRVGLALHEGYMLIRGWAETKRYALTFSVGKMLMKKPEDWVCERDFSIGTSLSGRVVGEKEKRSGEEDEIFDEVKEINGKKEIYRVRPRDEKPPIYVPYAFGKLEEWGSIAGGCRYVLQELTMKQSIRLWKRFQEINNNIELKIKDMPTVPDFLYNNLYKKYKGNMEEIKDRPFISELEERYEAVKKLVG